MVISKGKVANFLQKAEINVKKLQEDKRMEDRRSVYL